MTGYRAKGARCPSCEREPNVRFSEREVARCRKDRSAAHHTEVQCLRCGNRYWIRAGQIADADPLENGSGP